MNSLIGDDVAVSNVLAGPILRRIGARRMVLWLALREAQPLQLALYRDDDGQRDSADDVIDLGDHCEQLQLGERLWFALIDIDFDAAGLEDLVENMPVGYDILLGEAQASLAASEPGLCYPGERRPRFVLRTHLDQVLHGSCRRPHHPSGDGMARADRWLGERRADVAKWPTVMLLTGDQIYADDVAGPLLRAIHALVSELGLFAERLEGSTLDDSDALYACEQCYYQRDQLLPHEKSSRDLRERFFGGTEKPVFTSASSGNHLITFGEVLAMYLLCWSDVPWRGLRYTRPALTAEELERYEEEEGAIDAFAEELPGVRRVLANTPTAMIFDDHDITDDWNLTGLWMDSAYGHPFSKRIIGNALAAYLLCQGWGNRPEAFEGPVWDSLRAYTSGPAPDTHDHLVDTLLDFHDWGYTLDTEPAVVVLDTRTRRWRRTRHPSRPSGLMDWEALSDMQSNFMGRDSVVIVSAAPIFGVKLIENIQRIFTWFGKPLMVDAENWMAHPGAAHTLLNIFRHRDTPKNFTVLSGDVHYSFVYDVTLRHAKHKQRIWQIVSSGVKNEFPRTLLDWFDRLNRWLYAPYSPLNWFTKRRRMRVSPRRPSPASHGERLVNGAGMGLVRFNQAGQPTEIRELGVDDHDVTFDETDDIET